MEQSARGSPLKVLFAYPIDATFVRADLSLLQSFCEVEPVLVTDVRSHLSLLRRIPGCDLVYCWFAMGFAAMASLLAKTTGRKSIVVAGGFDVTAMQDIGYGSLLRFRGVVRAKLALSLASQVMAFSDWSLSAIKSVAPRSRAERVYLGVDTARFGPGQKERLVVCTSHVSRENLVRKGLRTFVKSSHLVPDARFVVVGRHWDDAVNELRAIARGRVEFPGWLGDGELRGLLSRAKVYVQPSYVEGFGLALAEAMASGCVPVVTRGGSLPELVGDTGFFADYGDELALASAIRSALESDLGNRARDRARERFNLDLRLRELRRIVAGVTGRA